MKLNRLLVLGLAAGIALSSCADEEDPVDPGTGNGNGNGNTGGNNEPTAITIDGSATLETGTTLVFSVDTVLNDSLEVDTGANLTWNFDWLVEHEENTTDILDPANTDWTSYFPNATAVLDEGDQMIYVEQGAAETVALGFAGDMLGTGADTCAVFSDPMTFIQYPITFGDAYTDDYALEFLSDGSSISQPGFEVDSIKMVMTGTNSSEVNGWGDLTIPAGTYASLKLDRTEDASTIIYIKSSMTGPDWYEVQNEQNTNVSTQFFGEDFAMPILELGMDSLNTMYVRGTFMK